MYLLIGLWKGMEEWNEYLNGDDIKYSNVDMGVGILNVTALCHHALT